MQTTLLSSKGQVILPKSLRTAKCWSAGTRLEVHDTPEGLLLKPISSASKVELRVGLAAIRQRIAYTGKALSLAEMDAAVDAAVVHEASASQSEQPQAFT